MADEKSAPEKVSGTPFTGTVVLVTKSRDVRKHLLLEEATNLFRAQMRSARVKPDGEPRLVGINHKVGRTAEYHFIVDTVK